MRTLLKELWKQESGQDLIEYALLGATFAVAIAGLVPAVAQEICTIFSQVSSVLVSAGG